MDSPISGMSTVNLASILFAFIAVLAIIGALKGLSRGISRQVIRTITIVASALIAFFISTATYTEIVKFLDGKTMQDLIDVLAGAGVMGNTDDLQWLANLDMETIELVLTLPMALIIMPIIFVIVFVPVSAILLIVHGILCALFGFSKKKNNGLTRILGMVLGLIQGAAVAGLLLMPVIGITNTVRETVTVLNEEAPEEESTKVLTETYNTYVKGISDNVIFKMYGAFGINSLYKSIATVKMDGESFDTTKLIPDLAMIVGESANLQDCDFKKLTPENEASINAMLEIMESDLYLKKVCAGAMKTAAHFYESETESSANLGEPMDSIMAVAMQILKTTDSSTVMGDLSTIRDVYFILSRNDVLLSFDSGSDALLEALTRRDAGGETTVRKIISTINQNERTRPLTTLMTQISISVISQQSSLGDDVIETYNNVIGDLNADVISIDKAVYATEGEYVAAVSESLDGALKKNNINLESEIVNEMAQYISDHYSDKNEITQEEANEIILSYYEAYLNNQISQIP